MGKRIKILQLAPQFPFPMDDGGRISIGNLTKQFSKQGAEVMLFCFADYEIPLNMLNLAKEYCKLEIFNHSTKNSLLRILSSIILKKSIYLSKHINQKIKDRICRILTNNEFNVIHADHTCMAPLALYAQSLIKVPVGLRLHNIEWLIWKRYSEELKYLSLERLYTNNQANILRAKEKEYIEKSNISFTISSVDFQRAKELAPSANIFNAPAGVDLDYWYPDRTVNRNTNELILATTYKWIHNSNALKWFLDEVFTLVMKAIPDIRLKLIGKEPPLWLMNYSNPNIEVLGYVEDVRIYLNKANVYIAPLFVGSGIRIKILEAMAMELPVVATSISAEGINASKEDGLFICDDAGSFAKAIIGLSNDFSKTRELGLKSREYIINNFNWEKSVSIILEQYLKLAYINNI